MLQSTVQMESSRSPTQTIKTSFSDVLQTFVQLAFLEAIKIRIDLLVEKILFTSFADSAKYVSNATVQFKWNLVILLLKLSGRPNVLHFRSISICRNHKN